MQPDQTPALRPVIRPPQPDPAFGRDDDANDCVWDWDWTVALMLILGHQLLLARMGVDWWSLVLFDLWLVPVYVSIRANIKCRAR